MSRELEIYSGGFNYHARKPWPMSGDLFVDLRWRFRNPIDDPAMQQLTGKSALVRDWVLEFPHARAYLRGLKHCVYELMCAPEERPVVIVIACAGGRHRSVVFAEELGEALTSAAVGPMFIRNWRVSVTHLHIDINEDPHQ